MVRNWYRNGRDVEFTIDGETLQGTIIVTDLHVYDDEASYDILTTKEKYKTETNPDGELLIKHIRQSSIKKVL